MILTTKLNNILDIMAPVKTVQVHTQYAAWLSDDTKKVWMKEITQKYQLFIW